MFVSHSMDAVESLCSHAYLIEAGRIAMEGPSDDVVRRYLDEHRPPVREAARGDPERHRRAWALARRRFRRVRRSSAPAAFR